MDAMGILRFWYAHNEQIIAVLVALFLITVVFLILRSFGESSESSNQLQGIEETLKKVLAQTPVGSATASVGTVDGGGATAPSAGAGEAPAQVFELTEKVTQREQQIETLKVEIEKLKAAPAVAAGPDPKMVARIKELEARLAEYEIIEDDIADLTQFKEENARLKAELEKVRTLQSAGGAAETPASATPAAAAPDTVPAAEPSPVPVAAAPAAEVAAPALAAEDPLAQFAAAVEAPPPTTQVAGAADLAAAVQTPEPAAPAAEAAQPVAEPAATAAEASAAETTDTIGALDTDKMIAEVESLSNNPTGSEDNAGLDEGLNTDKLMAEASALGGSEAPVVGEEDLLGEFKDLQKESS